MGCSTGDWMIRKRLIPLISLLMGRQVGGGNLFWDSSSLPQRSLVFFSWCGIPSRKGRQAQCISIFQPSTKVSLAKVPCAKIKSYGQVETKHHLSVGGATQIHKNYINLRPKILRWGWRNGSDGQSMGLADTLGLVPQYHWELQLSTAIWSPNPNQEAFIIKF